MSKAVGETWGPSNRPGKVETCFVWLNSNKEFCEPGRHVVRMGRVFGSGASDIMCKLCCCSEPGPPQRGGTGPWEALEMWLRPSCALEPSLPLTLGPPDGFAGRGDGAQDLRQTCPPQLRAAGEGGGGSLCRRVWVVAYLVVGPVVPIVPTLRSHGRHCSDQRLTTQRFLKIKSCSACPLSLSMGKAGSGGATFCSGGRPHRPHLTGPFSAGCWD